MNVFYYFKFFSVKSRLVVFGCLLSLAGFSQGRHVDALQHQVSSAIDKGYRATVRIWGYDTLRQRQNSSQFTGVVVDSQGTILTVAHAIQPGRMYKVRFTDGRETIAKSLGRIASPSMQDRPDMGMMRIVETGSWPFAEMGWSESMKPNSPCISIAFPESLNLLQPTIRFGHVVSVRNEFGFLESTCKMEQGDSGGPLFDLMGRVIGLHSRCDTGEDENYEVPVELYRKYWQDLVQPRHYAVLPTDTVAPEQDPYRLRLASFNFPVNKGLVPNRQTLGGVIRITGQPDVASTSVLGTVITYKGKSFIVSKSSIVPNSSYAQVAGTVVPLRMIARDSLKDLVLLEPISNLAGALKGHRVRNTNSIDSASLGMFIFSPLLSRSEISVISSFRFSLPAMRRPAYMGAYARFNEGKVQIVSIDPSGPASAAGLQQGDVVIAVDGVKMSSSDDYNIQMMKYQPGDNVFFKGLRNDEPFQVKLLLVDPPPSTHAADNFAGGRSARRDGFDNVVAHDGIILPEECGGPVYDLSGRLLGINIGRFSRTCTLMMPVREVFTFVIAALGREDHLQDI